MKEVAAAVTGLEKQGAQKLILDLRSCAVGEPEDGIALAKLFLSKGLVTYLQGQRVPKKTYDAEPAKVISKLPMVVLTNHGTADAAEVAAAALLDNKRARTGRRADLWRRLRAPRHHHGGWRSHHPLRGEVLLSGAARPFRMSA